MNHQVIGLILLVAAVATALYVSTNYAQLSNLHFNLPSLRAVDYVPGVTLNDYAGNQQQQQPSIQTASSPLSVTSIKPPTAGDYGEIVLQADWNIPAEGIDIKGWKIGSLSSDFDLPGAQEVYTFGGSSAKLVVHPGDEVHLFSGTSPRGNFRINKCIGYFAEFGEFVPPLEQKCPIPTYEETNYLSKECQSYVSTLAACETPKNIPVSVDDISCRDYLNGINYEGCVSRHRGDPDFSDRAIWVWVGDNLRFFNPNGDIIKIYDRSGKLVSQYRY